MAIVRPYVAVGNLVLYTVPGRRDVQTVVRVEAVSDDARNALIEYSDGFLQTVAVETLSPVPERWMQAVASIRQRPNTLAKVAEAFAAAGGDASGLERARRKHGVG